MKDVSVTAIVHSAELERALAECLAAMGCDAHVASGDPVRLGRQLAGRRTDAWLIEADLADATQVAGLERFVATVAAGTPVLAIVSSASVQGVRALLRFGVADVVEQPLARADLAAALAAATRRRQQPGRSKLHTFLKSGGGAGATTIATQAACSLGDPRRADPPVCLIDFDVQFGSVALHLDLDTKVGVLDVLAGIDRLDGSMLRGAMARHPSGIHVLPAPADVAALEAVGLEAALRLIDVARAEYETVLVELPQTWTAWTRALLSASTGIVLVLQPTVPSVRHARRQLDTLAEEGLGHIPLTLIANRVGRGLFAAGIPLKDLEAALQRPIDHVVHEHGQAVADAVNIGRRLADTRGGRKAARQLGAIAKRMFAFEAAPTIAKAGSC